MEVIVPDGVELDEHFEKTSFGDWQIPDWSSLSEEEKKFNARRMQTYAGMADNMDHNIGKLISHLKEIGELDNTLVVFMADNGTDPNLLASKDDYREWYLKNYKYTYMEEMVGNIGGLCLV